MRITKATITKIDPLKTSRTEKSYIRIYFKLEDGSFAKTDIVPSYRNYNRWKWAIKKGVGTNLGNLVLRKEGEIDADSYPAYLDFKPNADRVVEIAPEVRNRLSEEWQKVKKAKGL